MYKNRMHHYHFTFTRKGDNAMPSGSIVLPLDYLRVSQVDIKRASDTLFKSRPTQETELRSVSYLGYMTQEEFTGKPSESSDEMPLKEAIELLRMEAHDMEPNPPAARMSKAWSTVLSFAESI